MKIDENVLKVLNESDKHVEAEALKICEGGFPYYHVSVGGTWNHSEFTFNSEREVQKFLDENFVEGLLVTLKQDVTDRFKKNTRKDAEYDNHFLHNKGYSPYIKELIEGDILIVKVDDAYINYIKVNGMSEKEATQKLLELGILKEGSRGSITLAIGAQLKYLGSKPGYGYTDYTYDFLAINDQYPDTFILELTGANYHKLVKDSK